jgi:hypothetical protein
MTRDEEILSRQLKVYERMFGELMIVIGQTEAINQQLVAENAALTKQLEEAKRETCSIHP